MHFPGKSFEEVSSTLKELRKQDPPTHGGRVLSYVYDPAMPELDSLIAEAAGSFLPVNGLDPTTFTSVARLEREVVRFGRTITHGDHDVVGSVTSGGTESCLLAVKTARDEWRKQHGRGQDPVIVAPTTVHAAFHKACEYFDLTLISVDVDADSGTVDPNEFIGVVDEQSHGGKPPALVVLSAPNYPLGTIDPIGVIAPQMQERGIPVHVDACVGGFVLPFLPDEYPAWDFRVEGVRSMSLDAHKYGYAPKGVSLILYRGRDHHQSQYFTCVSWPGYPVVNPTILGSKSATALAAAWAIIHRLGIEGYTNAAKKTAVATVQVRETLKEIPGVRVVGEPQGPLFAIASSGGEEGVDPFQLIDALAEYGFYAQAQPAFRNLPRSAHISITPATLNVVDELCSGLRQAAAQVRGKPPAEPDPELLEKVVAYGLPDEVAHVMATLETLPEGIAREALAGVLAGVIDPDS